MLNGDRVYCDYCGCCMGQLLGLPAPQADLLPDLNVAPAHATCPDCLAASEVVNDPQQAE